MNFDLRPRTFRPRTFGPYASDLRPSSDDISGTVFHLHQELRTRRPHKQTAARANPFSADAAPCWPGVRWRLRQAAHGDSRPRSD
eukprot:9488050-Pyramimonas_sp.AAC.1